jgi:hypothetical protein
MPEPSKEMIKAAKAGDAAKVDALLTKEATLVDARDKRVQVLLAVSTAASRQE